MKLFHNLLFIIDCILIGIALTACVTSVDEKLPYSQLPEITVATQFSLVASPNHPTAYLSSDTIPAGEKVHILGMDNNAAWLLILHGDRIGWMPTFYSRTNVGTLKPALKIEPLSAKCTKYLGTTFAADEAWVSGADGEVIVIGSIYRPKAGNQFQGAALALKITGQGRSKSANYVHLPLTASTAVVLFAFGLADLQKDSRISFALTDASNESLAFQGAFFSTVCPDELNTWENEFVDRLPIGVTKGTLPKRAPTPTANVPTPTSQASTPTPKPTAVIIKQPSGPTKSPQSTALSAEIEQVLVKWDVVHHESDRTLDSSALSSVLTGDALEQQRQTLEKLQQRNCYWEFTDLSPSVTVVWQEISASEVLVDAQKHWDARLYCNGKFSERDSFDAPFFIRYRLILTDAWRIAEKRTIDEDEVMSTSVTDSNEPEATNSAPPEPSQLKTNLLNKSQNSSVSLGHRTQAESFVDALLLHLDDFQLPGLGITRRTMTDALRRGDAGDRINSLVQEVWADWQGNARSRNFDLYIADPGDIDFSPFRQLVIRMIQGHQGKLRDSQQHALFNYFTRSEDSSVWQRDPDAVIGAVNRESFRWP